MVGIYKITNNLNKKSYIGQSKNIFVRWKNHKITAFNPNEPSYNYPLYRAIRKYGLENFSFEILEECLIEQLDEKEKYYISFYNTYNNGYNQTLGGECSNQSSKLSVEQVKEIQKKLLTQNYTLKGLAEEYNVHRDTIRDINNGTTWNYLNKDLEYPLYVSYKNSLYKSSLRICPICGQEKSINAKTCKKCSTSKNKPSKESLENKLKELQGNFTKAGEFYGVSDNGVRRWCKGYNLPYHSKDYK